MTIPRLHWISLPSRTWIAVRGADAATVLHRFCTNHVLDLPDGAGCEAMFLNLKGTLLAFTEIYRAPMSQSSERWITGDGEFGSAQIKHLDYYVISEDVVFEDLSSELQNVLVLGLEPSQAEELGIEPDFLTADLPAMTWLKANAGLASPASDSPTPARAIRSRQFGSDAILLSAPPALMTHLLATIEGWGASELPLEHAERLRVRHVFPRMGQETDERTLPQELGRDEAAIHFSKGCYLGQETVARLDALGHVNRLLVRIRSEGACPAVGAALFHDDKDIGRLTSVLPCEQPETGWIGLANVKRILAKPGVELRVGPEGTVATVDGTYTELFGKR